MKTSILTDERLITILDIARLAPSVHNTQPWIVQTAGDKLLVTLDPEHTLTDGDPTGRETMISMGIFAEAIRIGAQAVGLQTIGSELEDRTVSMGFAQPSKSLTNKNDEVRLLQDRCTDRSIYRPAAIQDETIAEITKLSNEDIGVHFVKDPEALGTIADLISKGIRLALSNPSFRSELSSYLVEPWSHKKRGIAVKSLYLAPQLAVLQPIMMRLGIGLDAEAKLEKRRWESASGVIVITGDGDMPHYWFEAGKTYLKVSLAIEKAGLSQATSAAVVEASNFHEDVEQMLGTNQRILAMLRIGEGSKHREHSPRLEAEELLATSN